MLRKVLISHHSLNVYEIHMILVRQWRTQAGLGGFQPTPEPEDIVEEK